MTQDQNNKISAVLLAVLVDASGAPAHGRVPRDLGLRLRTVLEKRSRALAVAFGEHMACYDNSHDAARAASALQEVLDEAAQTSPELSGVRSRSVIDIWPDSEMDGAALDDMRALLAKASGQGVLLTSAARAQLDAPTAAAAHELASSEVSQAKVYELDLRANPITYREATRPAGGRPSAGYSAVLLTRRGKETRIMPPQCPFTFGRDKTSGMMLGGSNVSRLHGRIVYDKGFFYYDDESRNGTYLVTGGEEVFVHCARFPLMGSGVISPGEPLDKQTGEVVRFRCEAALPGRG